MMLNGDYYTIAEAAEFIASKTGKKKNNQDVLRDARKGKIRLCIWFDSTLYKFNWDKGTGKLQSTEDYKFAGYIQIPKKRITPKGGIIQFGSVTIIEVKDQDVWAKNRDPRTLDDNELSDRYFDSQSNSYQPCNLFVNLDEASIPEQDLLNFIWKNQEHEELKSISNSSLGKGAGRPRSIDKNAAILHQIIQILANEEDIDFGKLPGSAGDLHDACKRIAKAKAANNIFSTTQDTFKKWLKVAGYGFESGRTPVKEEKYWTELCVKNIEKIQSRIFT